MASLTEMGIKALPLPKRGQETHFDDIVRGFGVRVSQGGTKTYILIHGKNRKRTTLGRVGLISLSQARQRARELIAAHTLGLTPQPRHMPFSEARAEFLRRYKTKNKPSTHRETERLLNRLSFETLDITPQELTQALDDIPSISERQHLFVAARTFFNWCVRRGYIGISPLARVDPPHKPKSRERVLTTHELKAVWHACEGTFGNLLKMVILLGQRPGQFTSPLEVDTENKLISWSGEYMKGNRPHTIPYGALAEPIVSELPFKGDRGKPFTNYTNTKRQLDKACPLPHWTPHDLRRTFATEWAKLAIPPHITERMLAHSTGTISGVAAIYNRHSYLPEMREAVDRWEAHLVQILAR